MVNSTSSKSAILFAVVSSMGVTTALAAQVISQDLVVQGSECVGFDCVNGESFGFDTIRLKENNLRIKFQDTSNSGSFPSNDWQLTANSTSNGGLNYFAIDDVDGGRTPLLIEAGAPSNSIYVDDGGRVGFGTDFPVVDLHTRDGDTPTLRLEQDGSFGWTPQTWDIAGNETNFFVRDATNGSALPFRIRAGADSNLLYLDSDNQIGINTASPDGMLHLRGVDARAVIEDTSNTAGAYQLMHLKAANNAYITLEDTSATGISWNWQSRDRQFRITNPVGPGVEFSLSENGNLTLSGELTTTGSCSVGCDAVFSQDYERLSINEHAAEMWENGYLPAVGPTPESGQYAITSMLHGILNELEHAHIYISELKAEIDHLKVNSSNK